MQDIFFGFLLFVLVYVVMAPEKLGEWLQKVDEVRFTQHDLDLHLVP